MAQEIWLLIVDDDEVYGAYTNAASAEFDINWLNRNKRNGHRNRRTQVHKLRSVAIHSAALSTKKSGITNDYKRLQEST